MKRNILLLLTVFSLYSCNPATNARLWQDNKGCTILSNASSDKKITFVLQYPSTNKDSTGYVYKFEQTVGPSQDAILGCDSSATTITVIGAYEQK